MQSAVSIPDGIFRVAEQFAKQHDMSPSELCARAVEEYLQNHREDGLTDAINRVCDQVDTRLDAGTRELRDASLPEDEW